MAGADPGLTVLDASVAVRWLTEEVGSQAARDLLEDNLRWMAPRLLLVEMAAALRRKTLLGLIEADVARDGLRFMIEMVHRGTIQLKDDENLIQKALDLSLTGSSGKLPHFRAVSSWRSPDATSTAARAERGGADGG